MLCISCRRLYLCQPFSLCKRQLFLRFLCKVSCNGCQEGGNNPSKACKMTNIWPLEQEFVRYYGERIQKRCPLLAFAGRGQRRLPLGRFYKLFVAISPFPLFHQRFRLYGMRVRFFGLLVRSVCAGFAFRGGRVFVVCGKSVFVFASVCDGNGVGHKGVFYRQCVANERVGKFFCGVRHFRARAHFCYGVGRQGIVERCFLLCWLHNANFRLWQQRPASESDHAEQPDEGQCVAYFVLRRFHVCRRLGVLRVSFGQIIYRFLIQPFLQRLRARPFPRTACIRRRRGCCTTE